jgi:UDP-glucuronate decarboxylase
MASPWILTGASGWFGRTALWDYEALYGPEALRSDVVACASSAKPIDFGSPHGPIQAVGLEDLGQIHNAAGLIHLAFLTRDRVPEIGLDRYIKTNRAITATISSFLQHNPSIPIITTSSGAAAVLDGQPPDFVGNPYATLKQEEEALWRRSGTSRMASVFRVYAASGRFIKDPRLFALSDFLSKAIAGQQIEVRSQRPVIRSYVHVGTMMRLFWAMLRAPLAPGFLHVDACMQTLSLVELARIISGLWGLPEPLSCVDPLLEPDCYAADAGPFAELLDRYRIIPLDLAGQLRETASDLSAVWS